MKLPPSLVAEIDTPITLTSIDGGPITCAYTVRISNTGSTPVTIHEYISIVAPEFGEEIIRFADRETEHPPLPHTLQEGDVAVFRTTRRLDQPAALDELDYSGDCFVFIRLAPDEERCEYRKHMYFLCVEGRET